MLNLFVASINISPLSGVRTVYGQEGAEPGNIYYKFYFAPKWPSICFNQKCSIWVGSLHILYSLNLNGGLGVRPPAVGVALAIWGIY